MLFRIDIAPPKPVQGDFYAHILDSNMSIFFKFDTVDNVVSHDVPNPQTTLIMWEIITHDL